MATLRKNRGLQYPLVAEFKFDLTDTMTNTAGAAVVMNGDAAFDFAALPPNAVVIGGDVTVETASDDAGTHTIAIGDSGSATRYLGATSIKAAARTALVPTGYRGTGEDLRLTLDAANVGTATAGTVTVRVMYVVTGRTNEVQVS